MIRYLLLFSVLIFNSLHSVAQCLQSYTEVTGVTALSTSEVSLSLVQGAPLDSYGDLYSNFSSYITSTGYQYRAVGSTTWIGVETNATNAYVPGLASGTSYEFRGYTYSSCGRSWVDCESCPTQNENWNEYDESINVTSALTYPATPSLLSTSSANANSVTFSWNAPSGTISGYYLDLSTSSTFAAGSFVFQNVAVGNSTTTYTTANTLTPGTTYYHRVRAYNTTGASGYVAGTGILTRPAAPTANAASTITKNSFRALWQTSATATSYRLDVSTNNTFTALVSGYNNLTVNTNFQDVAGLAQGTTYYYRVRAVNTSGASSDSSPITVITIPPAPVNIIASAMLTTSFNINWQQTAGASSYRLDVSPSESFNDFVTGYNNLTVNGTSQNVVGLTPGTTYYFRVRAVNSSGTSVNSTFNNQITVCDPPALQPASAITATTFNQGWNAVTGADYYELDVASDEFFTSYITGYQSLRVDGTNQLIEGLSGGTIYHSRVRAVNTGGVSGHSTKLSQLTVPTAPANFSISEQDKGSTTIKVQWQPVVSATEYLLEVSTQLNFSSLVNNYNPKVIPSTITEEIVTGLTPSTIYYFRVSAKNQTGVSLASDIKTSSTLSQSGTNDLDIQITESSSYPDAVYPNQAKELSIQADKGVGALTVHFYHRKNSVLEYTQEPTTPTTGTYKVAIDNSWLDDFGMEFYFKVVDEVGQIKESAHHFVLSGTPNVTIPVLSFGKQIKNYQIISIPYTIGSNKINEAFEALLGSYNKKKWRFSQYRNGSIVDYQEGLAVNSIAQGQSYFFISKLPVELSFGAGKSHGNSLNNPFIMPLKKGWNQIGNPFPFTLSWQDVLTANGNPSVGKLLVFNQENVSFIESDALEVFGGGFVFADGDIELTFPVTLPEKASGRIGNSERMDGTSVTSVTEPTSDWVLPITLAQGEVTNTLSGIGMNSKASDGKDVYDNITPPRFVQYVEFNSQTIDFEYPISQDVVRPRNNYEWNFNIESNSSEPVALSWNKQIAASRNAQVILYDHTRQVLIDMAKYEAYSTVSDAKITIHYRGSSPMEAGYIELGKPYPNPFSSEITIPFDFTIDEFSQAEFAVYDLSGNLLTQEKINTAGSQPGIQVIKWNGRTNQGNEIAPGIYLYRMRVSHGGEISNFSGKIIKQ